MLIFALILMTFGIYFICWTDDKKSHLKRFYVYDNCKCLIFTFSKVMQQHT